MRKFWMFALGLACAGMFTAAQAADTGVYVGASVGQSQIAEEFDTDLGEIDFDEDEDAYKVFAGARFGLFGVEGGFVDFGNPEIEEAGIEADVDLTAYDLFGTVNLPLGPASLFAKAGVVAWEADATVGGLSVDDDGTDPAYGVGAAVHLTDAFSVRAEYEMFDVGDLDDLNMWSAGIELNF